MLAETIVAVQRGEKEKNDISQHHHWTGAITESSGNTPILPMVTAHKKTSTVHEQHSLLCR
jgi:hypothetical protein